MRQIEFSQCRLVRIETNGECQRFFFSCFFFLDFVGNDKTGYILNETYLSVDRLNVIDSNLSTSKVVTFMHIRSLYLSHTNTNNQHQHRTRHFTNSCDLNFVSNLIIMRLKTFIHKMQRYFFSLSPYLLFIHRIIIRMVCVCVCVCSRTFSLNT